MDATPLSEMNETEYSTILRPVPTELYFVAKPPQGKVTVPIAVDWRKTGLLQERVWASHNEGLNSSSNSVVLQWALETRLVLEDGLLEKIAQQELHDCARSSSLRSMIKCVDTADFRHFEQSFAKGETVQNEKLRERAEKKFITVPESTESYLHQAVMKGPVIAAIHASLNFRHYKSGVFFDWGCRVDKINYAVLVVGYGKDEDLGDYWLVKTTWGPDFGENGYARIARNRDNHCGIASFAYMHLYHSRSRRRMDTASMLWNYYASEYKTNHEKFGALKAETLKAMEDQFWLTTN